MYKRQDKRNYKLPGRYLRLEQLTLRLSKHNLLHTGLNIKLTHEIKNKNSYIKIKNKDECCFIYCITLAIDVDNKKQLNHSGRVYQYEKYLRDPIFAERDYSMPF